MPYKDPTSPAAIASLKRRVEKWKNNNPLKQHLISKNQNLKKCFGITLEDYQKMHEDQKGLCAICQKPEKHTSKKEFRYGAPMWLAVDHDHVTKRVRALLCMDCNKGLGCFGEDILRLQAAIEYLKKHSGE